MYTFMYIFIKQNNTNEVYFYFLKNKVNTPHKKYSYEKRLFTYFLLTSMS